MTLSAAKFLMLNQGLKLLLLRFGGASTYARF
jgi:hypothetical protein